jgi:uncharacterized RDD family membrane protein YckC
MRKCDYCGRENPDDAIHCSGCASQLQEEAPVIKRTKAGFWIRAAARVIDSVFVILIATLTGAVMGLVLVILTQVGLISPGWQHRLHGFSLIMLFFSALASLSYHSFCEGLHGATLGKLCCGICVVREDGRPSSMPGALIRSLAYFIDGLFFGAVAYASMKKSPLNQRYGDIWGKTAVIKLDEIAPE